MSVFESSAVAAVSLVTQEPEGARLLVDVEAFLSRFVAFPSEHARVATALWAAHAHAVHRSESTPRLAFLSPEPGSGKSRALEVLELLVPRPLHAVNATPAALFRAVSDEKGSPTILFDEIDTIFGPKAKDNEDVRGMLNAGHRRGATALRCVVRGRNVEVEEFPSFCAVALAGLGDMPDTIMTRSIVVRMRRRAPGERVEPFRHRVHAWDGEQIAQRLADWTERVGQDLEDAWPTMPEGVQDRAADVWEPLLALADAAGGDWPERARVAAVSLVTQAQDRPATLGIRLLEDCWTCFHTPSEDPSITLNYVVPDVLPTATLVDLLLRLDEAPWADMRNKQLDARTLARMLGKYDVKPKVVRVGDGTVRGYERAAFVDAWERYLPPRPEGRVTSETAKQQPTGGAVCTVVHTDSTACLRCGLPVDPVLGYHPACGPAS